MNKDPSSALLMNAIDAVELGVEDYLSASPRRGLSAVRNFYSGLLLLMKACLSRIGPELIAANVRPERVGNDVVWRPRGHKSADFEQLLQRWKSLGLPSLNDGNRLQRLRDLRNELEHREPTVGSTQLREAIAATFVVASRIVYDGLASSPAELFSPDAWETMRTESRVLNELEVRCERSRHPVARGLAHRVGEVVRQELACTECGSNLILLVDQDPFPDASARCEACGASDEIVDLIEDWCRRSEAGDTSGPTQTFVACGSCERETLGVKDDFCLICQERSSPVERNCRRCTMRIPTEELDTPNGLCSYCYQMCR